MAAAMRYRRSFSMRVTFSRTVPRRLWKHDACELLDAVLDLRAPVLFVEELRVREARCA